MDLNKLCVFADYSSRRGELGGCGREGRVSCPQRKTVKRQMTVKVPKWCGKWVVSMDEFKEGVVGAKSENLAGNQFVLLTRPTCPAFCHRSDLTSTSELRQALCVKPDSLV
jgi:hypothetical protein